MADDNSVSERDLDRALRPVEKAIDSLAVTMNGHNQMVMDSITKQQEFNTSMASTVATVTEQLRDSRAEIQSMSHLLRGNGKPGLTTHVERLKDQVDRLESDLETRDTKSAEKTKSQKALIATAVTGAGGAILALALKIVEVLGQ